MSAGNNRGIVTQPNIGATLAEHRRRIRALEAQQTGQSGIRYDFNNQGDWLYVEASDPTAAGGSINGYTIEFVDSATQTAFSGINLESSDGQVLIGNTLGIGASVALIGFAGVLLDNLGAHGVQIFNHAAGQGINIEDRAIAGGAGIVVLSDNGPVLVQAKTTLGLVSIGDVTLEAGLAGTVDIVTGSGVTRRELVLTFNEIKFLDQAGYVFYAIRNGIDPTRWDFNWVDPFDSSLVMSVAWNGASWDYKIKTGAAWSATL